MAFNSPRYYRWYTQLQTNFTQFNNTGGTWANTNTKLIRADQNSISRTRNAPYSRFPVLTGTRSEVAGIRGRKNGSWSIRGLPIIPSGAAGTAPDTDHLWQNAFGSFTNVPATSQTYALSDTGYLPFSLFGFCHGSTTLTSQAFWGCIITRMTFHFNGQFLVMDLDGQCGDIIDSTGFAALSSSDSQSVGGLTTFPVEPVSPTVAGLPIAGFGNGFTTVLNTQNLELKVRARSITFETGLQLVQDVEGSAHPIAIVGGARRFSLSLTALDDDTSALNSIKTACDTDNTTINMTSQSGTVAGSIVTFNVNNIQPNAFNIRDNGNMVDFEFPDSAAHASAVGLTNDATVVFT